MSLSKIALALSLAAASLSAHAFHPLVTDDTGTQGEGGNQLELSASSARAGGVTDRSYDLTYARGLSDPLDVAVSISQSDNETGPNGMGNVALGLKWRFYENEASKTSLVVKPTLLLPVSEQKENDGLGNGKTSPEVVLGVTQETGFGAVHANVLIGQDRFKNSDRLDRTQYSVAPVLAIGEAVQLALDLGITYEKQAGVKTHTSFVELGAVYALNPDLALSAGVVRLRDDARNYATEATVGVTWLFK